MKYNLYQETISYKDVMNSGEIFAVAGEDGVFYFCFDWYAPTIAKLWYKFSINPFDIDFLKFVKIDYGFIKPKENKHMIYKGIRYLYGEYNLELLYKSFFRGGMITNIAKKLNVPSGRISRAKRKYTVEIKKWLERIFKEYNFLDDSIEYIKEYYNNWIVLVDDIQKRTNKEVLWRFIEEHKIHSFSEFTDAMFKGLIDYMYNKNKDSNRSPNDNRLFKNMYKYGIKGIEREYNDYGKCKKYTIDTGVGYPARLLMEEQGMKL